LGDRLDVAPNLMSHHLRVLRETGLVDVERDALDGRWVYYSVSPSALRALREALGAFFDPARIKPRRVCGPAGVQTSGEPVILEK
jgi:ArsR family transcriptional regulator